MGLRSERATFALRIAFSAAAAVLVLAGASLNAAGRGGGELFVAAVAGLMAAVAGAFYDEWQVSVPIGAGALVVELLAGHFQLTNTAFPTQIGGLLLLALGGVIGITAYRSFTGALESQLEDVQVLNLQLEEKHRAFVAATADVDGVAPPPDAAALTAQLARALGASFACCYLAGIDGRQYIPQPPGIGLGRLHPQPLARGDKAVPLVAAVDAGKDFVGADRAALQTLVNYVPDEVQVDGLLAVPMPVGEHIGGVILLANKPGGFSDDDRRLAMTLTRRAGAQLVSAHVMALSQRDSQRYTLMNELIKQASGKTTEEVLALVLERVRQVIQYDAGRIVLFQSDDTFTFLGTGGKSSPMSKPLAKVRQGETVIRNHAPAEDGVLSGIPPDHTSGTVNEAWVPVRAASGVVGAICLGRTGRQGFNQRDAAALDELGAMAGVAVENSRILQAVTGQATKLDTALDALGDISRALTTVTQGAEVLEQKTLETAARVTGAGAALLTRTSTGGNQKVIMSLGFFGEVDSMEFANGQGIVGAVMLRKEVTTLEDTSSSFDLSSPPDLEKYGLRSALCVPMLEDGELWGTLSVFDGKNREWTEDDQRVLSTLGNQGVVAVRNAELYEKNERTILELSSLQKSLQAATSSLDLNEVLKRVLEEAKKASSAQIGCLALEDSGQLILKAAAGTDSKTAERLALKLGGQICRRVMTTREPVMQTIERKVAGDNALNPRAVLCVPLTVDDRPIGVVFLANYQAGHEFTADHRHLATELAAQAAVAIDRARLFEAREELILEALATQADFVDRRDPYTAGHSERVTQYALMIARQMRYAPNDTRAWDRLKRGVRMHDIGKIGVPDAVLQKPGKLTDEEFEQMKAHTTIGFEILRRLKMLSDELVIVKSHHERYDGKGYPDRKKGDELPIYAWIASAADAIDAMTSDRPYRKGMSLEVAIDQVRQGAGTHFHPDVAEAVLDAVHNGTLTLIAQESMYRDAPAIGAFENPVA